MAEYAKVPASATLNFRPFKAHAPEEKVQHFKQLLELSPIAPKTFDNSNGNEEYGTQRSWLEMAKTNWLNEFDWRSHEDRINSFPNFKAEVKDAWGNNIDLQFLALFSTKPDAIPLVFLHGYPTSICDFLDILDLIRKQTPTAADLPYHIIVPSLPGYGYSSGPPPEADYDVDKAASAINALMVGLGFSSGYLAQGGDLGSFISRHLALKCEACKGMHVNQMGLPSDIDPSDLPADSAEMKCLSKAQEFMDTEFAFGIVQGQKPATLGLALSSSPLALLAYLSELLNKFTDDPLPLDKILETVTLYWMTETFSRCIWHSRSISGPPPLRLSTLLNPTPEALKLDYVEKPTGYSLFPREIVPVPRVWAEKSCNLVWFGEHQKGGHLPAAERPGSLWGDVEEWVRVAWKK